MAKQALWPHLSKSRYTREIVSFPVWGGGGSGNETTPNLEHPFCACVYMDLETNYLDECSKLSKVGLSNLMLQCKTEL